MPLSEAPTIVNRPGGVQESSLHRPFGAPPPLKEATLARRKARRKAGDEVPGVVISAGRMTAPVRGLLCNDCNRGIGLLKDDYRILNNAYGYLRAFKI